MVPPHKTRQDILVVNSVPDSDVAQLVERPIRKTHLSICLP
jgi:hypothetical protein